MSFSVVMTSYLVSVLVLAVASAIVSAGPQEGDQCTFPKSGTTGFCTHISKCKPVLQAALAGDAPEKTCFHDGTVPVVCCDPNSISSTDDGSHPDVKEGDSCTVRDTGVAGTCTRFAQCASAKESAAQGIFPQKCNQTLNKDDLVCCGPGGQKARKYCSEMASKLKTCPLVENPSTSANGRVDLQQTAHMALMGSGEEAIGITWVCTGVLISERWVLTTARCLEVEGLKYAKLGGWSPNAMTYEHLYVISKRVPHPDYDVGSSSRYNDIGLLKLQREVALTAALYPACLHTGSSLSDPLTYSKWNGEKKYFKWIMEQVPLADCGVYFANNGVFPEGIKNASQSCSRLSNGVACMAADGAPLLTYNGNVAPCTNLVVGIQVHSDCKMNVETRVASNINWLESVVWPKF